MPNAGGRFNSGGTLPTSGFPAGYAPTFTDVTPESIRDSNTNPLDDFTNPLAAVFDTVVLNGMCDISSFLSNSQFKTRVEGFVSAGKKLIIWDSECTSTDYTNFTLSFKSDNPGAQGAQGTLSDTEDNELSSSNSASPSYLNLSSIAANTDAVGDANVFTSYVSGWFKDLEATNVHGVSGPVQAYGNIGRGLVIYSGLDKDDMSSSNGFDPASTSGAVHLNRVWLLELLQPWDPDGLPHANPVTSGPAQISSDPFTNPGSQHQTEVEPDTFAWGDTVVTAFQAGRFVSGGSSGIGYAVSTNRGATWPVRGALPGLTFYDAHSTPATPTGPYDRVSDPSVAYDAKHRTWMIATLVLMGGHSQSDEVVGKGIAISKSSDGGNSWSTTTPIKAPPGAKYDKNWIVCDNTTSSPFYGRCYVTWDDNADSNQVLTATSDDVFEKVSGPVKVTWAPGRVPLNHTLGGQPVVQPNGTVIVPALLDIEQHRFVVPPILAISVPVPVHVGVVIAYRSSDGGKTWSTSVISPNRSRSVAGNLRTGADPDSPFFDEESSGSLPSAEVDASGVVYVAWAGCNGSCTANTILFSRSMGGSTWSAPKSVTIDHATNATVDHFIPGLGVDRTTSLPAAHLGLTYYYYDDADCNKTTCRLNVGFVSSIDSGDNWTAPIKVNATPMSLDWLPETTQGRMVGDYISTSVAGGNAVPVFALALEPKQNGDVLQVAMYSMVLPIG